MHADFNFLERYIIYLQFVWFIYVEAPQKDIFYYKKEEGKKLLISTCLKSTSH